MPCAAYTGLDWADTVITAIEIASLIGSAKAVVKATFKKALAKGMSRAAAGTVAATYGLAHVATAAASAAVVAGVIPEVLAAAGLDEGEVRAGLAVFRAFFTIVGVRAQRSRPVESGKGGRSAVDEGIRSATANGRTAAESWGRPGTLADHFRRHGADFGARSAEEYAQQASKFLRESQARGMPTKIGADGTIRVYNPATNTFGSFNANGTTRTFYKPNPAQHGYPTNLDYWNAQPGDVPWTP